MIGICVFGFQHAFALSYSMPEFDDEFMVEITDSYKLTMGINDNPNTSLNIPYPVTELQDKLYSCWLKDSVALNPLKIDGKFGRVTKKYVIKFQKEKGLVPDGIVGKKTKQELFKACNYKYPEMYRYREIF